MTDLQFHGIRAASAVDALVVAASNSRLHEMKLLLGDGVDVNGVASFCGGLYEAARHGAISSVEYLVGAGAGLNVTNNKFDLTPLMAACSLGKTKGTRVAMRLIELGADVKYVRAADEMTALKFAVQSCPAEVIQTLIGRGAEVDGPPETDQTALMIAARYNNVAALEVLIKNGADVSLSCKLPWAGGRTAEGLAEFEKKRAALAYLRGLRAQ
jgi:ankyrin repeat protein